MSQISRLSFCVIFWVLNFESIQSKPDQFNYPEVRREDVIFDKYHGTKIEDPYRWLEDADSEETQKFIEDQNNLTFSYIEKATGRNKIRDKLTDDWNYPKQGLPKKRGNRYFQFKNSGLQNQWVLYVSDSTEGLKNNLKVFLDPNTLSSDGTVALGKISYSRNGELIAFTLSQSGSDWSSIHIRNVSTGEDFKDEVIGFTKFPSISWTHDNLGFFYTRYPATPTEKEGASLSKSHKNEKIYYHRVGTNVSEDNLLVEFLHKPQWSISTEISDEGDYLLVKTYDVINEDYLFYAKITEAIKDGFKSKLTLVPLVRTPASYSYIANDGSIFYLITNEGAPNYQLIGMDINYPAKKYWSTLVPEHDIYVLNWALAVAGDKMITSYMKDVQSSLELRHLQNGTLVHGTWLHEFSIEAGSIQSIEGKRTLNHFYFELATYSNPGVSYKFDLEKNRLDLELNNQVKLNNIDTTKFVTKQVFFTSKDGTKVPMFLTHKKDLKLTGDNPTLMYANGGFSSSLDPFFSIGFLVFVNNFDGVLAIPNIRGGGEYGTKWWDGGRFLNKQNGFDDFAAAAEYLIHNKYTSPSKLTIQGASNGGLLIGASVSQRPELFGAAIAEVGGMDMLRFQKFTVGSFWCGEYGCSDNKTYFENLITYSPLHNIRLPLNQVQYPAVLVQTADHDDWVVPLHSYKYIAELQHTIGQSERQTNPLMIRVEKKAGHGHGKPTSKQIDELVDVYSFLVQSLGYKFQ